MTEELNIIEICFYDENGDIIRRQYTEEDLKQFWPPDTNGEQDDV